MRSGLFCGDQWDHYEKRAFNVCMGRHFGCADQDLFFGGMDYPYGHSQEIRGHSQSKVLREWNREMGQCDLFSRVLAGDMSADSTDQT